MKKIILGLLTSTTIVSLLSADTNTSNMGLQEDSGIAIIGSVIKYSNSPYLDIAYLSCIGGRYNITNNLTLGTHIFYLGADVSSTIDNVKIIGDMNILDYGLDGIYHLTPKNLIDPFISIGVSQSKVNVDLTGTNIETSETVNNNTKSTTFEYDISLGLEYHLSETLYLTPSLNYSKNYSKSEDDEDEIEETKEIDLDLDFKVNQSTYINGTISLDIDESKLNYSMDGRYIFQNNIFISSELEVLPDNYTSINMLVGLYF